MCSFRAGNFDFIVIATHARWGDGLKAREAELGMLAEWIDVRFKDKAAEDTDLIVMGDFNTPSLDDKTFKALTSRGLQIPDSLLDLKIGDVAVKGSNLTKDARYDQILHLPTLKQRFTNFGGTLDFWGSDAGIKQLFPKSSYSRTEFTFQMSDHFPVWVQIDTDIDGQRLTQIVQDARK
jgi:endonuclease/exonuclease/phosphatase family metal-dependent hydrolase